MLNWFKKLKEKQNNKKYGFKDFHGVMILGCPTEDGKVYINGRKESFSNPYYAHLYRKLAFKFYEAHEFVSILNSDLITLKEKPLSTELRELLNDITAITIINEFYAKGLILEKSIASNFPDPRRENLYHILNDVVIHTSPLPSKLKKKVTKHNNTTEEVYYTILDLEKEGIEITARKILEETPILTKTLIYESLSDLNLSKEIFFEKK